MIGMFQAAQQGLSMPCQAWLSGGRAI